MTKKELKKEFINEYKEKNKTQYQALMILNFGSYIPLGLYLYALLRLVDIAEKHGRWGLEYLAGSYRSMVYVSFVFLLGMAIASIIVGHDFRKEWKRYLEKNRDRLTK